MVGDSHLSPDYIDRGNADPTLASPSTHSPCEGKLLDVLLRGHPYIMSSLEGGHGKDEEMRQNA